ncbi:MAG: AAA family ATPase [Candidatus Cryosericum sp.]
MKNLIVVGGPMGVGKSSACRELLNRTDKAVWLDGDWCWTMHPWQVNSETRAMVERNIIGLLRSFLVCSAYETVIFDWVLHTDSATRVILAGLRDLECRVVRVSLVCSPEELRARLVGDGRPPVAVDESLERLALYWSLEAPCLDTTGLTVSQVADRLQAMVQTGVRRS